LDLPAHRLFGRALHRRDELHAGAFAITERSRVADRHPEYQPVTLYEAGDQAERVALLHSLRELARRASIAARTTRNQPDLLERRTGRSLLVGPKPDKAYVVRGEYQRGPQTLADDGDVPIMPTQYHDAIVWRAA
jgi:hypothetical protein